MNTDVPSQKALAPPIKTQHAYADFKAFEEFTKKTKKKYRLAGNIIDLSPLIFFPFFFLTKRETACQPALTVCVKQTDWENKHSKHLNRKCSFIDIKKVEPLSPEVILEKMKDPENGFPFVGRLSDKKFKELRDKLNNLDQARHLPEKQSALIQCALAEADISRKILEKLSLN